MSAATTRVDSLAPSGANMAQSRSVKDTFLSPFRAFAERFQRSETDAQPKMSKDVQSMQSRCFKTLSKLQVTKLGNDNRPRSEYNKSVQAVAKRFFEFASTHCASDTVNVLDGVNDQITQTFDHEVILVSGQVIATKDAQLGGVQSERGKVIYGFINEAQELGVGQAVVSKAIDGLAQEIANNPLGDQSITDCVTVLNKLKTHLVPDLDITTVLGSDTAGSRIADAFNAAALRELNATADTDIGDIASQLGAIVTALQTNLGFNPALVNIQALIDQSRAVRQEQRESAAAIVAETKRAHDGRRDELMARREALEGELSAREDLQHTLDEASARVMSLKTSLEHCRKSLPGIKPVRQVVKAKTREELNQARSTFESLGRDLDTLESRIEGQEALTASLQQQIKDFELQLAYAIRGRETARVDLEQYNKAHKWAFFAQRELAAVKKQIWELDEQFSAQSSILESEELDDEVDLLDGASSADFGGVYAEAVRRTASDPAPEAVRDDKLALALRPSAQLLAAQPVARAGRIADAPSIIDLADKAVGTDDQEAAEREVLEAEAVTEDDMEAEDHAPVVQKRGWMSSLLNGVIGVARVSLVISMGAMVYNRSGGVIADAVDVATAHLFGWGQGNFSL